nr:MAG TPA: hypothetical protein [Caudoviricetes sp.]
MEKIKAPTRKEMFTTVSDFLAQHDADTDLIDFINHQIELLENKKESKKQSKEQEENATYSNAIYEQMAFERKYSAAELMKELPAVSDWNANHETELSVQKLASLLKPLVDGGKVIKTTEKRRVFYTKA